MKERARGGARRRPFGERHRGGNGERSDRGASARGGGSMGPRWSPPHWIALLFVFGLLALLSFRQVGSLDAGFHLKTGEYILAGHWPPSTDPFSFTMKDHAYTDTSWGYDVLVAAVQRAWGAPGLVVLHALLVLGIFALLLLTARLGAADPTTTVLLLLAGGLASEMRFEVRPELVSYFFLALVLYLLHRHAEGWLSPLWALPAIHLVWANMHGLFVLGWGAIGCFIAGLALLRLRLDGRLLLWGAASAAVTVVNPYGLRGVLFPLTLLTRLRTENVFAQAIGEFVSPFSLGLSRQFPFYPVTPIFCFRLLVALSILSALPLLFHRRFWSLMIWAGSLFLATKMIRNLPIFIVASLPGIVWGLPIERMAGTVGIGERGKRGLSRVLLTAASAASLVLALRVVHDAYYIASRRGERFGWGWSRLELPIDAVRYAARAGLRGPVLNHLNFGGYLMWARAEPVFIDGRLEVVGEPFFNEYRSALASEAALEACAVRYGIRWLIFPYATAPELLGRLSKDARWRLAYRDHLAAIFVREAPGAAALVDPGLTSERRPGSQSVAAARDAQQGTDAKTKDLPENRAASGQERHAAEEAGRDLRALPGLDGEPRPAPLTRWAEGVVRRQSFPSSDFCRGLFHIYRGELDLAESDLTNAIRVSRGGYYEIYSNLGSVLFRKKDFNGARACYELVLEEQPGDRLALERIAAIGRVPAPRAP